MPTEIKSVAYQRNRMEENEFEGAVMRFVEGESLFTIALEKEKVSELRKRLENVEHLIEE